MSKQKLSKDEVDAVLQIWEKTIDVQMHFNDIEMRIRALFISVILALVGAIGWVISQNASLSFVGIEINAAFILLIAGFIANYLFWFIDRFWYHQFLVAAVKQATALDKEYGSRIPALGLTSKISGASPISGFGDSKFGRFALLLGLVKKDPATFSDDGKGADLRSTGKIDLFYKIPLRLNLIAIIFSGLFGAIQIQGSSIWLLLKGFILGLCN